jgi:hypothetical protein
MKLAQAVDFEKIREAFPTESLARKAETIADLINPLLNYVFIIAGLLLFGYLLLGGFELLTSAGEPEKIKSAQGKLTSALIGFLVIFVSYWLIQILETIFGITILGF